MRTTKANLEAKIKMLYLTNEKLVHEIQSVKNDNKHLEERLTSTISMLNKLGNMPEAVRGATEALAHMLTDARRIYMNRR